jgi:hypothetical protein
MLIAVRKQKYIFVFPGETKTRILQQDPSGVLD